MSTDDGDSQLRGRLPGNLGNEGLGADNVQSSDTEQALGVENALGLQDLGADGNGRVDRVRDDEDESLGSNLGSNFDETLDNASINVEKVVAGHSGLACIRKTFRLGGWAERNEAPPTRNAGGDDNDVGIFEGSLGPIIIGQVAGDLLYNIWALSEREAMSVRGLGQD